MRNAGKWIIAAVVLLVLGLVVCGAALGMLGFNFKNLGTVKYVTKTYDAPADFRNIRIDAYTEDIAFVLSDDGKCSVVCREEENDPTDVSVQGDTLTIGKKARHGWTFMNIGVVTETPSITVYLPGSEYAALTVDADTGDVEIPEDFSFESINVSLDTGDVRCLAPAEGDIAIETSTGHISVSDLTAAGMRLTTDTGRVELSKADIKGSLEIRVSTGRVTLEDVTCSDFTSDGDTGRLIMTNVVMPGSLRLERSTGNIELNGCDAGSIIIKTDTGDVSGTLLTEKVFITESDTGKIDVPHTVTGGTCEISTDTGNITIKMAND